MRSKICVKTGTERLGKSYGAYVMDANELADASFIYIGYCKCLGLLSEEGRSCPENVKSIAECSSRMRSDVCMY